MHLKLDRENKVVISERHDNHVRAIYSIKSFLRDYCSDLLDVLKKHWEYKTKYHDYNEDWSVQLDLDI